MTNEKCFLENDYIHVYKNGTYFFPATNRYINEKVQEVGCDRCQRLGLCACVSYHDIDLCMQCISELDEYLSNYSI